MCRIANMGIPAHQIMIISGHKTMKSYEKYIKSNKIDDLRNVIRIVNQRYGEERIPKCVTTFVTYPLKTKKPLALSGFW